MVELLTQNWISLVFGLISAGAIAYARHINNKFKHFKKLETKNEEDELNDKIKNLIEPVQQELKLDDQRFDAIKQYFRYMIIEESERLLQKGFMTTNEYQKLSEMFKAYHGIGGNSQAEEFYHKAISLQIKDENEKKGED